MKLLLIVLVSVLAVGSSRADPVRFEGNFTQGGMAVGHTTPGSVVEFADRSIRGRRC